MPNLEMFLGTVQKVLFHVGKARLGYGGGDGFLGRWEARRDFATSVVVVVEPVDLEEILALYHSSKARHGGGPTVGVLLPELTFVGVTR